MEDQPASSTSSSESTFILQVDRLCAEFEIAWRGGGGDCPCIEDYLDKVAEKHRPALLNRLLILELQLRAPMEVQFDTVDYIHRFPGDFEAIQLALQETLVAESSTEHEPDEETQSLIPRVETEPIGPGGITDGTHASAPQDRTEPLTESTIDEGTWTSVSLAETEPMTPSEIGEGSRTFEPRQAPDLIQVDCRYSVIEELGEGQFGKVFLAWHNELGRKVAIKVPRRSALGSPGRVERFLVEARSYARLKHPNVVAVYDAGRLPNGDLYIVLEYIEGSTLTDLLQGQKLPLEQFTEMLACIADAMHYIHAKGFVHRDLKPDNILIDSERKPHVADLGLALHEDALERRAGEVAGTGRYMAPEQIRGEAHRFNGRTDIWALGVILYQGLTRTMPFSGRDRPMLFDEILRREPKPPRQIVDTAPGELERICLKCMCKKMADRYGSASALAEDLRSWLDSARSLNKSTSGAVKSVAAQILPKGLRAFGQEDADYFLDLLPGPKDRNGLPESVRFWKSRIDELDGDMTFSVGLLYGPSGCGKSSLVRAGLLPRLAAGIVAVYIDASPYETGPRILRALRKRLPEIPAHLGLVETFAALRRGEGPKVVVILDQFEQWLHAHAGSPESELVDALRQCDGGHLQAVVMVRDDFAMAAVRFMDALDLPILQGDNFSTLDLFDVDHARYVLMRFGQAFGRLPSGPPGPSAEQQAFLETLASSLARDGKVVSVRLALFAEMIKGKPWVPSTLDEAGGTDGIGVKFLEETFGPRSANPKHQVYDQPARNVLKALLPGVGAEIKGRTRSYEELREVSGLGDRPGEFEGLLRILDGELRLITPIDASDFLHEHGAPPHANSWQLTHDYLVPSLKAWLTRGQKETRRGRAELRLDDRAALWNARPEHRHLPSLLEWIGIRAFTDRTLWTDPQKAMMQKAARLHCIRTASACMLAAALLAGVSLLRARNDQIRKQAEADALVNQLLVADIAELPKVVASIQRAPSLCSSRLGAVADDPQAHREERFRATYALADRPGEAASRLIGLAPTSSIRELAAIRTRMAPYASALKDELRSAMDRETSTPGSILRIGALLAAADSDEGRWRELARPVANALLTMETLELDTWVDLLRPVSVSLTSPIHERFFDAEASSGERVNAALVLARYAEAPMFTELVLEADAAQFSMLSPAASRHLEDVVKAALDAMSRKSGEPAEADDLRSERRARNAAIALLEVGRSDVVEAFLSISENPTARTMVILEMRDFGVRPELLLEVWNRWSDPTARQAVLLSLGHYRYREFSPSTSRAVFDLLAELVRNGRHQSERAAAEWLLRRWGREAPLNDSSLGLDNEPAKSPRNRDWWVTAFGQTMMILGGAPKPLEMPKDGTDRAPQALPDDRRRFAMSVHEVTVQQYLQFQPDADLGKHKGEVGYPANRISFTDAMRYCRRLSELEGIPEDQMCYPPLDKIDASFAILSDERRTRIGYRLPMEDEWEIAARAGSTTPWFCGVREDHLRRFAWSAVNSEDRLHRVGMLLPNQFGLFDMAGNMSEWCHIDQDGAKANGFVLRGGCYNYPPSLIQSSSVYSQTNTGYSYTGFRLARTIKTDH